VILDMENQLLPNVDKIICTSQALYDRFESDYPCWLLPHGVDLRLYREGLEKPVHPCLASIPEPRVGYFGLLDDRTDRELALEVARALPDVSFVFTGPTEGDIREWRSLPNVHLTGPVPYTELPSVVRGWRASILPYRINELTEKINPLKLKEYLAGGRPVLATPLPEAVKLDAYLRVESTAEAWVGAIRQAIDGEWSVDQASTDEFLRAESWEHKAADFLGICEER